MNALIRNLIVSSFCLFIGVYASGQYSTKKYIKRNRKAQTITYGDSTIYARGLYNDSTRLFIGNSDGSMYYLNLKTNQQLLIFKMPHFTEMRDIEKYGEKLIGMHSGDDGKLVIMSLDGTMHILYLPEWKGVFFDGMDFLGKRGFIMGDPVDGKFSLFHTNDGGESWDRCPGEINAQEGEAGFAASGTNVQILNDSTYVFVSGGEISRFFKSTDNGTTWTSSVLPYYPGESTGPYTMCFSTDSIGVIAGGDYQDPGLSMNSCFYTTDGGDSWMNSMNLVRGYRSCVYHTNGVFYACGRNGIDFSTNGGKDWTPFADGAYFSMTSTDSQLIATTKHGSIRLFDLIEPEE